MYTCHELSVPLVQVGGSAYSIETMAPQIVPRLRKTAFKGDGELGANCP